ncbi:MAG: hypothetical protein KGJ58_03235 [Patescibacteria group bacterium]|nr:hypothetical protein [Patescibacteria group bacterium]MDE1988112.1 hypothetical protein [Patescibacteria group bacterium]MDE2218437.1 hypothetical protein [Patescibacteria group bacterium]
MFEDKNNHNRSEIGDTGVSFEDEWRGQSSQVYYSKTPKMNQWIINHSGGLVKDEKTASFVLLGVAAVAAVIAFYLSFGGGLGASDNKARDQMLKIHPELRR